MVHPIRHKVAESFKLKLLVGQGIQQGRFHEGLHHLQAVGVQGFQKVFATGVGLGIAEQAVVQTHLGLHAIGHAHPGDHAFGFHAVRASRAALGFRKHLGMHFGHHAVGVFAATRALDHKATFQADHRARAGCAVGSSLGWA